MVERLPANADAGHEQALGIEATVRGDNELVLVFGGLPEGEVTEVELPPLSPEQQPDDVHVVQAGDTLSSIALQRLGSAALAEELARLNGLDDPDQILPGDRLRLR
jgi:nucleoid-associated protein YgaU